MFVPRAAHRSSRSARVASRDPVAAVRLPRRRLVRRSRPIVRFARSTRFRSGHGQSRRRVDPRERRDGGRLVRVHAPSRRARVRVFAAHGNRLGNRRARAGLDGDRARHGQRARVDGITRSVQSVQSRRLGGGVRHARIGDRVHLRRDRKRPREGRRRRDRVARRRADAQKGFTYELRHHCRTRRTRLLSAEGASASLEDRAPELPKIAAASIFLQNCRDNFSVPTSSNPRLRSVRSEAGEGLAASCRAVRALRALAGVGRPRIERQHDRRKVEQPPAHDDLFRKSLGGRARPVSARGGGSRSVSEFSSFRLCA